MSNQEQVDFSKALTLLKKGYAVTRVSWPSEIVVKLQVPDKNSKMTEPYLYMEKKIYGMNNDFESASYVKRFPLDLSCESIMATDWVTEKY